MRNGYTNEEIRDATPHTPRSDKIALDRFVVDYGGRLRLDKLQEMIGNFLKGREEEEVRTTTTTKTFSLL